MIFCSNYLTTTITPGNYFVYMCGYVCYEIKKSIITLLKIKKRHRTIRMTPSEVSPQNEQRLLNTVYNYKIEHPQTSLLEQRQRRRNALFKVGDYVRLSKYRTVFAKGYTPNWTTEIFKIRKVQYNTDPITYLLDDYQNHEIKGSVYAEELQRVKHPDVYLVEKIIRRRNGQVYVKWLGFDAEHNSWIPEKEVF